MKAAKKIPIHRGDDGTTGLRGGPRVPKDHPRVEAGGDLDELSAAIGADCAFARRGDVRVEPLGVELDLLDVGTRLADPAGVYLNRCRERDFRKAIEGHFDIVEEERFTEGEGFLTPGIERELSAYGRAELTTRAVRWVLRLAH